MKKYIPFIVVLLLIAIAGYFVYMYMDKIKVLKETAQRIMNNTAERTLASERAQRNGTTVQYEAEQLAKKRVG